VNVAMQTTTRGVEVVARELAVARPGEGYARLSLGRSVRRLRRTGLRFRRLLRDLPFIPAATPARSVPELALAVRVRVSGKALANTHQLIPRSRVLLDQLVLNATGSAKDPCGWGLGLVSTAQPRSERTEISHRR